jgi:polyhydroxyalkanoate synthesis regulator phasin
MPTPREITTLKTNLKQALLRAQKRSSREIVREQNIDISDEKLEEAEPSQAIDARERADAITTEVTVLLLERIEQLESQVEALETRLTTLNTKVGTLSTPTTTP